MRSEVMMWYRTYNSACPPVSTTVWQCGIDCEPLSVRFLLFPVHSPTLIASHRIVPRVFENWLAVQCTRHYYTITGSACWPRRTTTGRRRRRRRRGKRTPTYLRESWWWQLVLANVCLTMRAFNVSDRCCQTKLQSELDRLTRPQLRWWWQSRLLIGNPSQE